VSPEERQDDTPETLRERLTEARFATPSERTRRSDSSKESTWDPRKKSESGSDYTSVKSNLHSRLLNEVEKTGMLTASEDEIKSFVHQFVDRVLQTESLPLNDNERRRLAGDLAEETLGVGPLAPLMLDPAITDILVNAHDAVYIERFGQLEKSTVTFKNADHLLRIIQRIVSRVGRRIDSASPMVDARLPDGSRINATIPPVSIDGPTLSIRRFGRLRLRSEDLLKYEMFTSDMMKFVQSALLARRNVIVSGGPGAGKSTFLGAMAEALDAKERIVTIEDAAELNLTQEHVVRFETRAANIEGKGELTTRDLVRNSLRMRPDRLIIGEVRGAEALDMLQAMNTGHDGGVTTLHANSARDAISRLETMVLMAGIDLPSRAIREQIVSAIHLVVHVRRYEDGVRRVESIAEITGMEGENPLLQEIFRFDRRGMKAKRVDGRFRPAGIVPRIMKDIRNYGIDLPLSVFGVPGGK
jgi:pilus assembly protein CpaF